VFAFWLLFVKTARFETLLLTWFALSVVWLQPMAKTAIVETTKNPVILFMIHISCLKHSSPMAKLWIQSPGTQLKPSLCAAVKSRGRKSQGISREASQVGANKAGASVVGAKNRETIQ
jgi:hypothetical protein